VNTALLTTDAVTQVPSPLPVVPFVALLLAIAVCPLVPAASRWWEHNQNKLLLSLVLGALVLGHYSWRGFGFHGGPAGPAAAIAVLEHALLREFAPFLALIASLYVITGGLEVRGDLRARPAFNTAFLGLGALLASLIGTTGASMVLIRPLLETNRERKHVRHTIVFFIFVVSNIGGCLLPLGDPPLFLGYLQGVPFTWTLTLLVPWMFSVTVLLAVYFVWDTRAYRQEDAAAIQSDELTYEPVRLRGTINLVWLLGVVAAVALIVPGRAIPGTDLVIGEFVRETVMLGLIGLSLATTPRGLRRETEFSYGPIAEVACLFLGIFLTMQVPIEILHVRGPALGLTTSSHFFWASGSLSSVLDNAPTYAVFFEAAKALPADSGTLVRLLDGSAIASERLTAISLGSVFMGANTYIGNGPNLMVKSIAERHGVVMPSFFGYTLYSAAVLLPLFAIVTLFFLR
jgi:Na+/H+ antiporter NhaD/arsenite permease-like protein